MAPAAEPPGGDLEVRCAGCGETLEVERGLTEFICPDCATPQALPLELMPRPPRRRRALPFGAGPGAAPARVPCGGCGAVLTVPRGLPQRLLACPLCGAEIAVDGGGRCVAAYRGIQVISPPGAVTLAATFSRRPEEEPISQAIRSGQVQVGRYIKPIHLEQTGGHFPAHSVREEPASSLRSKTRTAAHVDWVKSANVNHSVHREESHINLINETVDGHDFRKQSRPSAGPGSVCIDKARVEHPSKVRHAPQGHERPSNQSFHTEEAYGDNQSCTIGRIGIQKAKHGASSRTVEKETVGPPSPTTCPEHVEVESCGNKTGWQRKRKRSRKITTENQKAQNRGLTSPNEDIHLTCSNCTLAEGTRNRNPIQQPSSSNGNQFDPVDIDRIIARLCPSSLPQKQVSQERSNTLGNTDATLPPVSINHGAPQGLCFSKGYRQYRAVATASVANHGLNSAQEHEIPQESSYGTDPNYKSRTLVRPYQSLGVMHRQQIQECPSNDSHSQQALGLMHRQQIQEGPDDDSHSQQGQVGSHCNKIVGHNKNITKGSMYFSNDEAYIREQPHPGTHHQATLVTVCSNPPTTSSPLPTATLLPTIASPSVVTRPQGEQPQQYYQSSDTLRSQGAHTAGVGSIDRSSNKRRGRGRTKLIEQRREADRPVLTPNNADTWDVDPPCPKVASTISALLKQWHPGSTYVPVNQHTNEVHQEQLILHWHQYHSDTRAIIMDEFLQRYKWAPGQETMCLKLFDRKIVRQFTGLLCDEKRRARMELAASRKAKEALDAVRSKKTNLNAEDAGEELKQRRRGPAAVGHDDDDPFLWKPFPPEWMQPRWWEMLCEHWASEEVLQVSAQKRKNRYTGGSAQHTAGSRSIAMHRKLMIIENGGKPVSDVEVFNKTHKRDGGKGEFISERAKKTLERFKRRLEEAGDTELDPHLVWAQAIGGRKRGRYYGLHGIIDKARIDAMAKSTPGFLDKETQKEMFTQDQVQEMISQAMQQLNETWEKRFQSLEQRMHGMRSLEVPQHSSWPCAATPVVEEDQASHQDASDSSHEGIYETATDDDEDYVDN